MPDSTLDWSAKRGERWLAHLVGMESMFVPIDAPLIAALRVEVPCRIADIGCGGGGTSLEIQRRSPPGSSVHGFDISTALIEHARGRAVRGEPKFDLADVAKTLPPEPFDRLVSRFGVMFFEDQPAAFASLLRWLAPRGRCAFAVWGPPEENRWVSAVREIVARIVELPRPDPTAPGQFRYADPAPLVALLRRSGFAEVETRTWRGDLAIGGGLPPAEAAWFALSAFADFGQRLKDAGEAAVQTARKAVAEQYEEIARDGVVFLPACVHIVSAMRP